MNYIDPSHVHTCPCRDRGASTTFCMSGHLTECHYPLDCRDAACSHLPRYSEDFLEQMPRFEHEARQRLTALAHPTCNQCNGSGLTTVQKTMEINVPESMLHILQNPVTIQGLAICPCAARRRPT